MRGVGGVRRLSLLAGGCQTYPRSPTIKLPYVTKNFITFTFYFNIFNIISNCEKNGDELNMTFENEFDSWEKLVKYITEEK